MKRRIMKIFAPLALIAVLIFSTIFASGCYIIKGVKMKELKGTYEMTHYSAKTDIMGEREIKMYMVINSDGNGYYVYQDKDTELYAAEMRCRFTTNQEDSSKYDYVECEFTGNNSGSSDSWYKFGVNSKILNYHKIVWKQLQWGKPLEKDYDINVSFKKISSKTDLSFVEKELKTELTALPYGLVSAGGVYELNGYMLNDTTYLNPEEVLTYGEEQPVYGYVRLDVFNNKMTVYTMFASDEEQQQYEQDFTITGSDGAFLITDESGLYATLTATQYKKNLSETYEVTDADGNNATLTMIMNYSMPLDYDLTETIANKVAAYEENKCYYGKHEWTTPDVDQCEVQSTCSKCGAKQGENIEHVYDDDNDVNCNICGKERLLPIVPPEVLPEDSEEPDNN